VGPGSRVLGGQGPCLVTLLRAHDVVHVEGARVPGDGFDPRATLAVLRRSGHAVGGGARVGAAVMQGVRA